MRSTRPARWMRRMMAQGKSKLTTTLLSCRFWPSDSTSVQINTRTSSALATVLSLDLGEKRQANA